MMLWYMFKSPCRHVKEIMTPDVDIGPWPTVDISAQRQITIAEITIINQITRAN